MRTLFAVGLFLAVALLMPSPSALSAPPHKQASSKKPPAVPLTTSILGTWKGELPAKNGGAPARLTVTFKKDGTEIQLIETPGHRVQQWIRYQIADGWITQALMGAADNGKPFKPTSPGAHRLRLYIRGDTLSIATSEGGPNQLVLHRAKN